MLHTFRAGGVLSDSGFRLCRRALRGSLGALRRGALRRLFHRGSLVSNGAGGHAGGGRIACGCKDGIVDLTLSQRGRLRGRGCTVGGFGLGLAVGQAGQVPAAALAAEQVIHILGGRVGRGVQDAVITALGGDIAHGNVEQAVLLEQSGDGSAEGAHAAGDGDLIALGRLIELDSHVVHLKALVGQLEAGAHQLCQIGIHIHRGQQQLFGVGVRVVVIKASLGLLDAVHAAPDGGFAQG